MTTVKRRTLLKMIGAGAVAIGGHPMLLPPSFAASSSSAQDNTGGLPRTMSDTIADFIVDARFDDLPTAVIQKAKEQIVFFFGRAFEGSFDERATHIREIAKGIATEEGGATVIAERFALNPSEAAFANCSLMRGSTRDDVIWPAGIHAGVITLPTALAIGEVEKLSGRDLLLSLVLGYEVVGKLAIAAYGWSAPMPRRPTIIYGGFAPVTVAGRMLKLDRHQMANALGYAANLTMGVPEGGMMQHYYSFINRNGILAAKLARVGAAPYKRTTIEGELGLYRSFFGEVPKELPTIIDSLGSDWEMLKAERKVYPGTGANTVAIELLFELVDEYELTAGDIVTIDAYLHPMRRFRAEVSFRGPFKRVVEAYSSLPYALALVMIEGEVSPEKYGDLTSDSVINDKVVAAEMQKVSLSFEEGHEPVRWCRLEVQTIDGRKLVREADGPKLPFPRSAWREWLQKDGQRLLSLKQLRRLEHIIGDLENLDDVSKLMATVVPAASDFKQGE